MQSGNYMRCCGGIPLLNHFTVLVQDLDVGTFQLFTVRNVYLANLDFGNTVGNGISPFVCRYLLDKRCFITGNLSFSYCVLDLSVIVQFDQIGPGILPAVVSIQLNGIAIVLAISFQLDHDLRRTFAARIVIVVPDLFDRNICRLQRVGNEGTIHSFLEAGYFFFFYCVVDRGLAVFAVLRQFLGSKAPVIVRSGGYSQGINDVFAILDINRDAPGQQFGIVVLQLPDLLAADCRHLRNVCVLDVVAGDDLLEALRNLFIHRIGDFRRAVFTVHRQIPGREGPFVLIAGAHGQGINDVFAILDVNRDVLGHNSLIITLQIPGLLAADLRGLQRVLYRICAASVGSLFDLGRIVRNLVFRHRVINIIAVGFLFKIVPGIRPVVGFVQFNGCFLRSVSKQVDCHIGRTGLILVVAVFPDLLNTHLGLLCCVRIAQRSD